MNHMVVDSGYVDRLDKFKIGEASKTIIVYSKLN